MPAEPVDHNKNQQAPEMDLARYTQDLVERFSQPRAMDVVFWSPPEDPDKPSLPYLLGFNTTIYPHQITGTEEPKTCRRTPSQAPSTRSSASIKEDPSDKVVVHYEGEGKFWAFQEHDFVNDLIEKMVKAKGDALIQNPGKGKGK